MSFYGSFNVDRIVHIFGGWKKFLPLLTRPKREVGRYENLVGTNIKSKKKCLLLFNQKKCQNQMVCQITYILNNFYINSIS